MNDQARIISYIVAAVVLLVGLGLLITFGLPGTAEANIGAIIILLVGITLTLMFILSAGFNRLNLSDANQALGLPEGSVRALIAIFLIVVFVGIGIYIFRSVAYPTTTTIHGLTQEQVAELAIENILATIQRNEGDPETFNVVLRTNISQDGVQLGQQVINVLGTLVVAVAGFYFGARAVTDAQGATAVSQPVIRSVYPNQEKQGKERQLVILGKNFSSPKVVKLIKQNENDIVCSDILSNETKITCTLQLGETTKTGPWHLVVVNDDGSQDQLDNAFTVNDKPSAPS